VKLNLGCGQDRDEWPNGFINIDIEQPNDATWDLSVVPWPWHDDSIGEIRAWHILEHLPDRWSAVLECWRILEPDGILDIKVPHASGIYACSMDHLSYWSTFTFTMLESTNRLMNADRIMFRRRKLNLALRHPRKTPILDAIATRWPLLWETLGVLPPAILHWVGKKNGGTKCGAC